MARRAKRSEEGRKRDAATIMFLSLNMILLAFFILLVALSQPDKTKQAELAMQVRKAFESFGGAYLGLGSFPEERGISPDRNPIESSQQVEQFLGELTRFIEENKESRAFSYEIRSEGMTIQISSDFAFAPGSDRLLERSRPVLEGLYNLIRRTDNPVRIEGYTDNREKGPPGFRDPWALSAARAVAVFRFLTADGDLPPDRFSVIGYGSERPLASNLTAAGREANRRVTVSLVGRLRRSGEESR